MYSEELTHEYKPQGGPWAEGESGQLAVCFRGRPGELKAGQELAVPFKSKDRERYLSQIKAARQGEFPFAHHLCSIQAFNGLADAHRIWVGG